MKHDGELPVLIVGAGPTGLEAALACVQSGVRFRLLEAGSAAGAGIGAWAGVRLFTPWRMNLSARMSAALRANGHDIPPDDVCPTGAEFIEHGLAPIARLPEIAKATEYCAEVIHIGREGLSKDQLIASPERAEHAFRVIVRTPDGERVERASAVLDCSGGRAVPNWVGDGGVPALGEEDGLDGRIHREIPNVDTDAWWRGSHTLLVGAGHSAQTAARDLAANVATDPATRVTWAVRDSRPDWGSPVDDPLPGRAALSEDARRIAAGGEGVDFIPGVVVDALTRAPDGIRARLRNGVAQRELLVDHVLALTGRVGDHMMYRQLQVHECYATVGPIRLAASLMDAGNDCLNQPATGIETITNPEPQFFVLGAKSYGRNTSYLLQVGYEQVDQVVRAGIA